MIVTRGDIFIVDASDKQVMNEISLGIVISNRLCNKHSPVVTIIPVVSKNQVCKYPMFDERVRVEIDKSNGLKENSIALCEYPMSFDKRTLKEKVGHCNRVTIDRIIEGNCIALDIKSPKEKQKEQENFYYEKVIPHLLRFIKEIDFKIKEREFNKENVEDLIDSRMKALKDIKKICNDENYYNKIIQDNNIIQYNK